MKLLFYDADMPRLLNNKGEATGGAAVRQYAIAKGLIKNGHKVGILTWKGARASIDTEPEFDLVESFPRNKGVKFLRYFYIHFPLLYKAVKGYKPDFLFQKSASIMTGMLAMVGNMLNVPFVYMATSDKDGDDRIGEVRSGLSRWMYNIGLKRAHAVICQNQYQIDSFRARFPKKHLILMTNPYWLMGDLPTLNTLKDRGYFAWVGNFIDVKNMPAVYDIVSAMPHRKFKIAGSFRTAHSEETEMAVNNLKLQPNVEFVGYLKREEVVPFLSKAYALFNTSYLEGFSNTFLEAFAAGTPVVTRECIDPDNLISRNKLGITIADYDGFTDALETIATLAEYPEIVKNCREYLLNNHDPLVVTKGLVADLDKSLAKQNNGTS